MTIDFCGIGNAGIDIIANVHDQFLVQWNFPKSICTYLNLQQADALEAALPNPQYIPGGCSANVADCISALGGTAAFIGRMADDSIGRRFLDDLKKNNIRYTGIPDTQKGAGSTRIFTLVTPDAERTFASYYGVQEDLSVADLDRDSIKEAKFLCMDGYALNARVSVDAFAEAATIARAAGRTVVLSPNDLSILDKYKEAVDSLIPLSDMILVNAQEAMFMTRTFDLSAAIEKIRTIFKSGAVTAGQDGVYVFDQKHIHHVPVATPPAPVTDTNGAGDAFAAGLLFGLCRDYDLRSAAALGNRCAAVIITHPGARPRAGFKEFVTA